MKNKEESLFLYIVFKRRQKLNLKSWGEGRSTVDLNPMTKDSHKGTAVNPQGACLSLGGDNSKLIPRGGLERGN